MINEGVLLDIYPKRSAIPVKFDKDSWKTKTRIPLRKQQPTPIQPKKNFIRNKRGELVEQKPLGYFRNELKEKFLEHSLMNPVVPTLTHQDMLMKWPENRAKLDELKKWKEKRLQDDAKAKREELVVDKKSINDKA